MLAMCRKSIQVTEHAQRSKPCSKSKANAADPQTRRLEQQLQQYMHLNNEQADELAVLRRRRNRCLSCVTPAEAACILYKQDQHIEQLKQQFAAIKAERRGLRAAMDDAKRQYEAEVRALRDQEEELQLAKVPWKTKMEPVEKAVRLAICKQNSQLMCCQ